MMTLRWWWIREDTGLWRGMDDPERGQWVPVVVSGVDNVNRLCYDIGN